MAAIDDARRFLYLHPFATTSVDNPVQLLQEVVDEYDKEQEQEEDEDEGMQPDEDCASPIDKLLTFVKGLRDDMKICEAEYQTALALVK